MPERRRVTEPRVDGRLVRDERDPTAAQRRASLGDEHVESGLHTSHADDRRVSHHNRLA